MKFKNISGKAIRDATLELSGEREKYKVIEPGEIIEVNDPKMIERVKANRIYEEQKPSKPKAEPKTKKEPVKEVK